MDAARMAVLIAYCRIDEPTAEDKLLLESMVDDAQAYLAGAGVTVPDLGTPRRAQYDQLVNAAVLDSWENRGTQAVGVSVMENPAFRRKLNQLKLL